MSSLVQIYTGPNMIIFCVSYLITNDVIHTQEWVDIIYSDFVSSSMGLKIQVC